MAGAISASDHTLSTFGHQLELLDTFSEFCSINTAECLLHTFHIVSDFFIIHFLVTFFLLVFLTSVLVIYCTVFFFFIALLDDVSIIHIIVVGINVHKEPSINRRISGETLKEIVGTSAPTFLQRLS